MERKVRDWGHDVLVFVPVGTGVGVAVGTGSWHLILAVAVGAMLGLLVSLLVLPAS